MNISDRLGRGFQHQQKGDLSEAKAIYEEVLQADPNHPDALYLMGALALQTGHQQPATQYFIHAVNNNCAEVGLYTNLSKVLRSQNNHVDAHKVLARGAQLHPDNSLILIPLGIILRDFGQYDDAIKVLTHALEIDKNSMEANLEIALAYQNNGDNENAERHYKNAIFIAANVTTYNSYAVFLAQTGREEQAIEEFHKALKYDPKSEITFNNLGFHLYAFGQIEESLNAFQRCLKLNQTNPDAHALSAFSFLLKGNYTKGWQEYEWRFKTSTFPPPPLHLDSPIWRNEPLEGKTIILLSEQGYGDTFQFVRFAETLSNMGAKVLVAAPPASVDLLKSAPGVSDVFAFSNTNIPAHDFHIYMMSLPVRLDTTLSTIPNAIPYLSADPKLAGTWKDYFASYDKLKVGIVWSGNAEQRNNTKRSCPLSALAPLFNVDGVQLFSLAKTRNEKEGPLPSAMVDLSEHLHSFSDTAAIMVNLDLVISVCTSTAHLAGALGCPVWILLAASADWRWMLDREDSPWYPTARLLRQDKLHGWDQLLENVAKDLAALERQKLLT